MKSRLASKIEIRFFRILSILILASIFVGATSQTGAVYALTQTTAREQTATQPANPIDPWELEAFLDDLLETEMAAAHVPGAMVAVVQDGRPLLSKGYGYADLDNQTPVNPERTLFRIGSISKLFVWTAVMQLVEQGQLSLDTDVNEYLDFAIPATYAEPITMRHLMSHTAGFEDKGTNMHKLQAEQMGSLANYLQDNLPALVFPPGEVSSYSNYGTALAGYIVECISGLSFNEYVEQNIFAPLGMVHSSFRQPLPETLAEDMAIGYHYANEHYVAGSFVFNQSYPVGAMSASANDMARFMITHLQNGELDGQRILQEETAIQMHSQMYSLDPSIDGGMAYGFFKNTLNGQRVVSHGGNLFTFMSGLVLLPDQSVGVFVSTNGTHGADVVSAVMETFFDHYYPMTESPDLHSADGFAERIVPYLGEYTPARSNFSTPERIYSLTTRPMASLSDDGILVFSYPGGEHRFAEVAPGLLQAVDDPSVQ